MTRIRVLIVDDSAFARKVIREVLSQDPEIDVVGIARDGLEALEKVPELRPDVITLDLLMPDLDGLGFLRALPKENAPRVIVVSASPSDSDLAIEALQSGAIDLVTKPTPLPTNRLYDMSADLVRKVKTAALARPRTGVSASPSQSPALPNLPATAQIVVVGTSTGGPQALTSLFKALPANLPVPLVIALHIPAGYTAPLAARLSKLGQIPVDEAADGMEIMPGRAVVAAGGLHLRVRKRGEKFFAEVSRLPIEAIHHPSVDILFESAAQAAGSGVIAIVMTGMGSDGFLGTKAIREVGGRVLAESASSCVVFGMPRCVIEGGTANFEAVLDELPALLVDQIYK
ncbi:MAG: chemotaxis-specific protein-glutamate methyltransferase CheB [Bdellovibrionota bacterium]